MFIYLNIDSLLKFFNISFNTYKFFIQTSGDVMWVGSETESLHYSQCNILTVEGSYPFYQYCTQKREKNSSPFPRP